MDYVTASSMEWMEMDARTIHFHAVDTWTVDVEWIASLNVVNKTLDRTPIVKPFPLDFWYRRIVWCAAKP